MRCILTYHSLDDTGSPVSIRPDTFRRHVDWLDAGPAEVVPLARLRRLPPDRDAVALTFDDGFRSFLDHGWPLLRDRGLPATLFVVTGHVGGRNDWGTPAERRSVPDLPLLGWEELDRLAEEGVEIASHTRTHPRLGEAGSGRVADEVEGSADDIERRLGRRPRAFAYPYGSVGPGAEAAAGSAYELACTTRLRELRPDDPASRLPRLDAHYFRKPGQLEAWGTPWFRSRLRVRAGGRRLRRMLGKGPR